jgi:hypothetical protein
MVSPSPRIERMRTGRNRSPPLANRVAKGASTWSTNAWRSGYSRDATEWPSMRHTMRGANTSVMGAVPSCQAWKARPITSRLASVSRSIIDRSP